MTKAKAIMVQGTMSNAGKSLLVAGLCRIFAQDGFRVAPFKSQNMALNSFVGDDGLELGRAQAMQAEAAGIAPDARMNPILLKPTSVTGSQVIVRGRAVGTMSARDYFAYKRTLRSVVEEAYRSLASENDIIVIEGAGSPAEINLKDDDIVNMGMARMANSPVLLAGDIDPGGVFAQLYGTLELLEPEERSMVKGLIVNKFRGDTSILAPGIAQLESLCKTPVVGVVPYLDLDIDDEDSLSARLSETTARATIDIAVAKLPHLSNFTDFNALSRRGDMGVRYVDDPARLGRPDLVIVPGTKNTLADLRWLRESGLASCIVALAGEGTPTIGICGGYQILGTRISDPAGAEEGGIVEGLGLLPSETVFEPEKELSRVRGTVAISEGPFASLSGMGVEGYEIHMGATNGSRHPAIKLDERVASACEDAELRPFDGDVSGSVWGTYLHGVFDAPGIVDVIASVLLRRRGLPDNVDEGINASAFKESQYDALGAAMRQALDMDAVYRIVEEGL